MGDEQMFFWECGEIKGVGIAVMVGGIINVDFLLDYLIVRLFLDDLV